MAIIWWPKQISSSFAAKDPPLSQLFNVGEAKNAGVNPQPYNIEIRGGGENWWLFVYLVINCSYGLIFLW